MSEQDGVQPGEQVPPHIAGDPNASVARDPSGKIVSVLQVNPDEAPKDQDQLLKEAIARAKAQRDQQFANPAAKAIRDPDGTIRFGTGLTDAFLPQFGINPVLVVTTPGSGGSTLTFQGIEDYTPPARDYQSHDDTPLTGTYSGKALVTVTTEKSAMIVGTMIYGTNHRSAYDAIVGTNYSTISLTLNDGSIYAGKGALRKLAEQQQSNNNSLRTSFEIVMNAGWTYTAGSGGQTNA